MKAFKFSSLRLPKSHGFLSSSCQFPCEPLLVQRPSPFLFTFIPLKISCGSARRVITTPWLLLPLLTLRFLGSQRVKRETLSLSLSEKNQPVILSRTLFSPPRQRILPPFPSYRFLSPALATNSLGDSLIFLPLFDLDHYRAGTGVFTERILQERYTLLINQSRAYTSSPRFTQISLG